MPPNARLPGVSEPRLRFRADGGFTVLQINDTQDIHRIDRRTLQLIERSRERTRPDLVVLNGDVINENLEQPDHAMQAMNNIAATLDRAAVPWCVTFGNHDADARARTGYDEVRQLEFYRRYRHNLNLSCVEGLGPGTQYLPILDHQGRDTAYGVWLLHSGCYAPRDIAGQDFQGYPGWDWVRGTTVAWYHQTSTALAQQAGRVVPSVMFMHLPLWEHQFMWFGGVEGRTAEDAARGRAKHDILGERNEGVSCGPFNSGLFAMILDRGETRAVFCGHDHLNSYHGNYYGVLLGFTPGAGYGTYGFSGPEKNRLRGVRVFRLREDQPEALPATEVLLAGELGIDTGPEDQRIDPLPFPSYIQAGPASS